MANETEQLQAPSPGQPPTQVTTPTGRAAIEASGLEHDRLVELLHMLVLCRYFDERMETLYRQGRLPGAIYSGRGQEGTHVGSAFALGPDDSLFPTHRDLSAQLAKGLSLKRVMAQFWGRIDGYTRGRDGNSHIGDWSGSKTFTVLSNLPNAYPVAAGAALAYQMRGESRVALAICGDGATSNGRWHECLNVSGIKRLPVVWVVNNNQYAYSTPNRAEFPVPTIAERGPAYGMPGYRIDGTDVLQVYTVIRQAVERARSGEGPTLVESVSLRWKGHAGHDPAKYMPKELLEDYMTNRDPVKNFAELLVREGVIDEARVKGIRADVEREFDEGFEFAQQSPLPDPDDVDLGVYADDGYWEGEPSRSGGTA